MKSVINGKLSGGFASAMSSQNSKLRWFRPLLAVSLGLHGLLLLLPMALPTGMSAEQVEPEVSPEDDLLSAMQVAILPTLEPVEVAVAPGNDPLNATPPPLVQPPVLETELPILDIEQVEIIDEEPPVEEPPLEEPPVEEPPLEDPPQGDPASSEPEGLAQDGPPPVYSGTGTSSDDANLKYWNWSQQIAARYPGIEASQETPDPLTVIAASSECRTPEPQTASVGIVASADGTVLENEAPEIIKSSGWDDLNAQVIDHAKSYASYPTDGEIKFFLYDVEITYGPEGCTANTPG